MSSLRKLGVGERGGRHQLPDAPRREPGIIGVMWFGSPSQTTEDQARSHGRRAKITDSASRLAVGEITEVAHQRRHPALVGAGETDHVFNLGPLLLAVGDVGFAPLPLAGADVLGVIQHRAAVNPQLLQGPCRKGRNPSASVREARSGESSPSWESLSCMMLRRREESRHYPARVSRGQNLKWQNLRLQVE